MRHAVLRGIIIATLAVVCGCSTTPDIQNDAPVKDPMNPGKYLRPSQKDDIKDSRFNLFSTTDEKKENKVNAYLWKATLNVLKEFPLDKIDAESRYVMTEWYNVNAKEKYKLYVQLVEHDLTSNSVDVKVYKRTGSVETLGHPELETKIRNEILNRAREIRVQERQ